MSRDKPLLLYAQIPLLPNCDHVVRILVHVLMIPPKSVTKPTKVEL